MFATSLHSSDFYFLLFLLRFFFRLLLAVLGFNLSWNC
jgi:hypothetical protein